MKTSELVGDALNWAVTYALHGEAVHYIFEHQPRSAHRYSTNWYLGGQIIEREKITVEHLGWISTLWQACVEGRYYRQGPTPLIAAMRCYVASKLGDEVEVPNGLQ
jgi:Protein of unknown function (DUF2591)